MVASEENMTGAAAAGRTTAELLQSVHKVMTWLGHDPAEENRSPSKAGGG
jgi:hypothetical protein